MGKTLFQIKGARLNSNRRERLNVVYGVDKRLDIQVVPESPLLHVIHFKTKLHLTPFCILFRLNFPQYQLLCFVVKFSLV